MVRSETPYLLVNYTFSRALTIRHTTLFHQSVDKLGVMVFHQELHDIHPGHGDPAGHRQAPRLLRLDLQHLKGQ
jgi:hypothetical protein